MTACVDIDSNGYLIANGQTADNCQSYVLVSAPHYEILVEPVLDADSIAYVFGWGFGAVVVIGSAPFPSINKICAIFQGPH